MDQDQLQNIGYGAAGASALGGASYAGYQGYKGLNNLYHSFGINSVPSYADPEEYKNILKTNYGDAAKKVIIDQRPNNVWMKDAVKQLQEHLWNKANPVHPAQTVKIPHEWYKNNVFSGNKLNISGEWSKEPVPTEAKSVFGTVKSSINPTIRISLPKLFGGIR